MNLQVIFPYIKNTSWIIYDNIFDEYLQINTRSRGRTEYALIIRAYKSKRFSTCCIVKMNWNEQVRLCIKYTISNWIHMGIHIFILGSQFDCKSNTMHPRGLWRIHCITFVTIISVQSLVYIRSLFFFFIFLPRFITFLASFLSIKLYIGSAPVANNRKMCKRFVIRDETLNKKKASQYFSNSIMNIMYNKNKKRNNWNIILYQN